MKKLLIGLLCAAALACISAPARADSGLFFVQTATVNASGAVTVATFTATARNPVKHWALQVKGVGAAASSWDVRVEGSLDGVNFSPVPLAANVTGNGDGAIVGSSTAAATVPVTFARVVIKAVSLGSATGLTVSALGSQ